MPVISRLFGIIITINYREHGPPHFHAWYAGVDITLDITDGRVRGHMADRATSLVLEWWRLHRDELMRNWERARAGQPLNRIEPLE